MLERFRGRFSETFTVAYDGEAVADGRMEVRDLAPALLALSDLVAVANKQLHGDKAQTRLEFQAVGKGSLEVHLAVDLHNFQQLVDIFTGDDIDAVLNILSLLGLSVVAAAEGLFHLIKKAQGRQPETVIKVESGANVQLNFGDGNLMEVRPEVYELYANTKARKQAFDVVKPLERPGIDEFAAFHKEKKSLEVHKEEVKFFQPPDEVKANVIESISIRLVTIVNLAFKEGNKWRVCDGENEFNVDIVDESFVKRVLGAEEAFYVDDVLMVKLLTRQWTAHDGLKTEHEIREVLEIRRHGGQGRLDLSTS